MWVLMFLQVASYWEALVTLWSSKYHPLWVKLLSQLWTFERLLSCFGPLIILKEVLFREALVTFWASVWVLSWCFKELDVKNTCHTLCTWMASLLCGSFCVSLNQCNLRNSCHTVSIGAFLWIPTFPFENINIGSIMSLTTGISLWNPSCFAKLLCSILLWTGGGYNFVGTPIILYHSTELFVRGAQIILYNSTKLLVRRPAHE